MEWLVTLFGMKLYVSLLVVFSLSQVEISPASM